MNIKAIFFDLDGTLVDSEYFHYQCWNEILLDSEITMSYDDWLTNYAGIPLSRNAESLIRKYSLCTPLHELIQRREALSLTRLATEEIPLMYHAKEMLDYLHQKNFRLALVTGSPRRDVDAIFLKNGLGKYFEFIVTSTDVSQSKPDPESYDLCRTTLGLQKDECIAFEDTLNGIKSAKAAGLTCYAIQRHLQQQEQLSLADQLFLNFEEAKDYLMAQKII